ncbi:MAG TPA: helix-turn-helix domain-containing protein [Lysobacter sp.]|nr:helix-turn-helix domain-containing protein [Lysobacter sp.]
MQPRKHVAPHPPATEDAGIALGRAIRDRRKALRISMVAAAEAAGFSKVTWYRIEKGEDTVAIGYWLQALAVLGLEARIVDPGAPRIDAPGSDDRLPVRIRLAHYPQLARLAWQVRAGIAELSPREALGLYERNWRHVDQDALRPDEQALITALRRVLGGGAEDV